MADLSAEKIIVWLSEQEFPGRLNDLPEELRRLMAKGIEFRFVSENFRSHKKYHYVFREYPDSKVITVDDDLIYPRNTVERLLSLSYQYPDTSLRKRYPEDSYGWKFFFGI